MMQAPSGDYYYQEQTVIDMYSLLKTCACEDIWSETSVRDSNRMNELDDKVLHATFQHMYIMHLLPARA